MAPSFSRWISNFRASRTASSAAQRAPRPLALEALESRQVLSASVSGTASDSALVAPLGSVSAAAPSYTSMSSADVLNFLIANSLSKLSSANSLLGRLNFDQVFQAMSPDILMLTLLDRNLVAGYSSLSSLRSGIAARGIDLTPLRPDGMLTVLSTAPGGSFLNASAVAAKQKMADFFYAGNNQKLAILDNFSTRQVLTFFADQITTSSTAAPDRFYVNSWPALAPGQSTPGNPAYLDNVVPMVIIEPTGSGSSFQLPSVQATLDKLFAVKAPGQRALLSQGMHRISGYGPFINSSAQGYIDRHTVTGSTANYYFLWMDRWETAIKARFDTFFSQLKAASQAQLVDGQRVLDAAEDILDAYLVDMEDSGFSYQALKNDRRVNQSASPQLSFWQELLGDTSVGRAADPRWSALKTKLLAAGLSESDLSLAELPNWSNTDPRIAIWNSVLEQHRAGYLNRAIYEPIVRYFPNINLSNYGNFQHSRTLPVGSTFRFTESSNGIGSVVGNHQSVPIYGDDRVIVTPDPEFGTLSPNPPPQSKIWLLDFAPIYSAPGSTTVVGGNVTVTLNDLYQGFRVGDGITLINQGGSYIDPWYTYTANFPIQSVQNVTVQGKTVTRLTFRMNVDHELADADLTSRLNATNNAYVVTWRSWNAFLSDVQFVRSMIGTSTVPVSPWISSPNYNAWIGNGNYLHWQESVYHTALSGTDELLYWRPYDMGSDPNGNILLSQVLKQLDRMVGYADRKPLSFERVDFNADYVLSGVEANGQRIWRLTPNPNQSWKVTPETINGVPTVTVEFTNGPTLTFRYATLASTAQDPVRNGDRPLGYWITQTTSPNNYLWLSVDDILTRINTEITAQTLQVNGPDNVRRGSTATFTLIPSGTNLVTNLSLGYTADWNGDGVVDQSYRSTPPRDVSYQFNTVGVFAVTFTATDRNGRVVRSTRVFEVDPTSTGLASFGSTKNGTSPTTTNTFRGEGASIDALSTSSLSAAVRAATAPTTVYTIFGRITYPAGYPTANRSLTTSAPSTTLLSDRTTRAAAILAQERARVASTTSLDRNRLWGTALLAWLEHPLD